MPHLTVVPAHVYSVLIVVTASFVLLVVPAASAMGLVDVRLVPPQASIAAQMMVITSMEILPVLHAVDVLTVKTLQETVSFVQGPPTVVPTRV